MKKNYLVVLFCALLLNMKAQPAYINRNSQDLFINGMNLAWINFGNDLGAGFNESTFMTTMQQLRDAGANSVRWWIHVNGTNNPQFTNDTVSAISAADIASLKKALDLAYENGVLVDLCLWSFDMLQTPGGSFTSAMVARNKKMLTDSLSTVAYIRNALVPMLNSLKGHKGILCWEVFNEPEGMSTQFGWTPTRVDMKDIQRFTNMVAGAIHRYAPGEIVTNGSWSFYASTDVGSGHKNYYSKTQLVAAGKDTAGYLDFYSVHYYPANFSINESPFQYPASHWALDKPIVIAEFPANGITEKNGTKYTAVQAYEKLYNTGYAGAMGWTINGGGEFGGLNDAAPALKAIYDLDKTHVKIITKGINVTPYAIKKLPQASAILGSTDTIKLVNFSQYFEDEDPSTLAFTVAPNDTLAKYFFVKQDLNIVPKTDSAGVTTIYITATDTGGKSITYPVMFFLIDTTSDNLLQYRDAYSSTDESNLHLSLKGVDKNRKTRWASALGYDHQWYTIKLEKERKIKRVMIEWEAAYAYKYALQASTDSINWQTLFYESRGNGDFDKIVFNEISAKYLRLNLILRRTDQNWGFSFWEIGAYDYLTANTPPHIDMPITDKSLKAGKTSNFYVNTLAVDPDLGDRFTYTATLVGGNPLPSWLSFADSTMQFKAAPAEKDTGIYNIVVKATDMGGEQVSDTFKFTVKSSINVGIKSIERNVVSVYPVPAQDYVNIQFDQMPVGDVNISIIDYTGRVVSSEKIKSITTSIYSIKLNDIKSGNYILKISSKNINNSVPIQIVK